MALKLIPRQHNVLIPSRFDPSGLPILDAAMDAVPELLLDNERKEAFDLAEPGLTGWRQICARARLQIDGVLLAA